MKYFFVAIEITKQITTLKKQMKNLLNNQKKRMRLFRFC